MFQPNNNSVLFSKLMHDKVALEPSLVTHWKTQTPNKSTVVSSDSCLHTLNTEENAQFLQVHKLHSRTKFCYCPCIIYVCTLKKKKFATNICINTAEQLSRNFTWKCCFLYYWHFKLQNTMVIIPDIAMFSIFHHWGML